jgi:hypothetical protein
MHFQAEQILKLTALCVVLAGAETLHGIARVAILVPRVGKSLAQRVSIVTGSLLAFAVCYFLVPGLRVSSVGGLLGVGCVCALFMAAFDVTIGRLVMRRPWARIAEDFSPRRGNYLVFGLVALVFMPLVAMSVQ